MLLLATFLLPLVNWLRKNAKHVLKMKENKENLDPTKVNQWIAILIAILSAIAGALGESATNFISNLNLF